MARLLSVLELGWVISGSVVLEVLNEVSWDADWRRRATGVKVVGGVVFVESVSRASCSSCVNLGLFVDEGFIDAGAVDSESVVASCFMGSICVGGWS